MARVLVLPGDGIGPEVTAEARAVLAQLVPDLELEEARIGGAAIEADGTPLSDATVARAKACGLVLLGAVGGPAWDGLPPAERPESGLLRIRKELGLFANLRPARVFPALLEASPLRRERVAGLDLIVVRELIGGIYYGEPRGRDFVGACRRARNTMVYDEEEIERIARVAFETARRRRRRVTNIHKANVLDVCGLWNEVVEEIAQSYPDVELEHQLVDSAAMLLLRDAAHFDVLLCPNLFGDILSDEAAMITGSLGLLPSASLGRDACGLFEPVHGSAPDLAGRDVANPLAAILSCAMLLEQGLGRPDDGARIRRAVERVLETGGRTADLAAPGEPVLGTREMGKQVRESLAGESGS